MDHNQDFRNKRWQRKFRKELCDLLAAIMEKRRARLPSLKRADECPRDFGDVVFEEHNQWVARAVAANDERQIADIKATISRIDNGAYGICEQCGKDIPDLRLAGNPLARLCLGCQSEYEGTVLVTRERQEMRQREERMIRRTKNVREYVETTTDRVITSA